MSVRCKVAVAAAIAAGVCGHAARAGEDPFHLSGAPTTDAVAASTAAASPDDRPLYLQTTGVTAATADPAAGAPRRRPLMQLLDDIGVARPLDDARINVYGYVEGSVTKNVTGGPRLPGYPFDRINLGRAFDIESDDPTLNQVALTFERPVDRRAGRFDVGFRVDTIYGSDTRFFHANGMDFYGDETVLKGPDEQFDLPQVYADLAFPVGNGLRVRLGKFTYFKSVDPNLSPFYSRSFSYNPGALPFTLTGVLGTYDVTDRLSVDAGVVRGWDQALEDNNGAVSFVGGAAYRFEDNRTTLNLKLITGPELPDNDGAFRTAVTAVVGYKVNDNLTVFADAIYGMQSGGGAAAGLLDDAQWYGLAGYALYRINPNLSVNARLEWFRDEDAATIGVPGSLYEVTLGLTVVPFPNDTYLSGFKIRPEVRWDYFSDAPVALPGEENNQVTIAVDAIFNF